MLAGVAALGAAGCGGSHGNAPAAAIPHTGASTAAGSNSSVRIALLVPARPAAARRKRQYVSEDTESAAVLVNGTQAAAFSTLPNSGNCAALRGTENAGEMCSAVVDAPNRQDTFTLNTYDGPLTATGATSGSLLSSGTATQTITAGVANTVNLTLDGVVAYISNQGTFFTIAAAGTANLSVSAVDAAGDTIVGPGNYVDDDGEPVSILLSLSDASKTTSLLTTSVSSPSDTASASYDGELPHGTVPVVSAQLVRTSDGTTIGSPVAGKITIPPQLKQFANAFSSSPVAMTGGTSGSIYLLEPNRMSDGYHPIVAAVDPSGTVTEYPYMPCAAAGAIRKRPDVSATGTGAIETLFDGIATAPNGSVTFGDYGECGGSSGELVSMTPAGTFSSVAIATQNGPVSAGYSFGYAADGTAELHGLVANSGNSFVDVAANGTATSYGLNGALGLTMNQHFESYFGGMQNAFASDAGYAWFPGAITDSTTGAMTYVLVRANTAGATYYDDPANDIIYGLTAAQDGNVWYDATRSTSGGYSTVVGRVTPAGSFTDFYVSQPVANEVDDYGIADGASGGEYVPPVQPANGIAQVKYDGSIVDTSTGVDTGGVTAETKTTDGNIYVLGNSALYELQY